MSVTVQNVSPKINIKTMPRLKTAALGFGGIKILAFIVLLALLLGVIFILPNNVDTVTAPRIATPSETETVKEQAPPDSPWSDAQLAKQRREAQEILSKVIDLQEKLEDKNVKQWAKDAFEQAMETTASGDELYRQRQFDQAQQRYKQGLEQFTQLINQIDVVFNQQMQQGLDAINNAQPRQAIKAYQLASDIKPANTDAQQGLARAKVQNQVIDLIAKGKHQLKTGKLQQAKQTLEQALSLDSQSTSAQQQLTKTKAAIVDANFASAMSKGYAAINKQHYPDAIAAFEQAQAIKPSASDTQAALEQAKNKHLQQQVATHLATANQFEQQEQWQQANDHFDKVIALDSSVIKAKIGVIRTQARAELDTKLSTTISQAERLTDTGVQRQTQALLQDAKRIKNKGHRLNQQIATINQLLERLNQPVSVEFKSNNQTLVTLYRVGELGNFTAKQMSLKPGKYTLVGTRQGYRDVRQEFTIEPGKKAPTVVVQCEEKITNG